MRRDGAGLVRGDALRIPLRDASVDLIVTSPPYFALRSYRDGDEHFDGQLGSEATPADFLRALWAVMDECHRVLKPTGVAFVNLGDSYQGSGGYNNTAIGAGGRGPASYRRNSRGVSTPGQTAQWTKADAAWLAGVIDCDGSISAHVNTNKRSFVAWIRIGMMRPEVCERAYEVTGVGRVFQDGRGVYNWHVAAQQARYVLLRIWPWLRIKQRQALAAIELCRHTEHVGASGKRQLTDEQIAYRTAITVAIQDWNQGRPNDWTPPSVQPLALPDRLEHSEVLAKSVRGLPWRFALGLACPDPYRTCYEPGEHPQWLNRRPMVWHKPNGLPESVTDRCRANFEDWFMLTKQGRYFSAVDEVREPHAEWTLKAYDYEARAGGSYNRKINHDRMDGGSPQFPKANPLGKLPGSVWAIPSEPLTVPDYFVEDAQGWRMMDAAPLWTYVRNRVEGGDYSPVMVKEIDHFAAFTQEWPRRLILGWSPSGICTACGEGRRPVVDVDYVTVSARRTNRRVAGTEAVGDSGHGRPGSAEAPHGDARRDTTITGYACACPEPTAPTRPAVVLDPFVGTGTTVMVARALGRYGVGLDLSADYLRLARWRVFESGHAAKSRERANTEAQGRMV